MLRNFNLSRTLFAAAAAAMLLPAAAHADADERARAAIATAQAKIDLASRAERPANEYLEQARQAMTRAQSENGDGDEDRARDFALEAAAYAELALATSDMTEVQRRSAAAGIETPVTAGAGTTSQR